MAKRYGYTSRYSLADYMVTITIPAVGQLVSEQITIGGPGEDGKGSCIGEIKVTRNTDMWSTEADATGSWVHNKTLDKTGTVELNIRQVSNYVIKLMQVCSAYESIASTAAGLTISVGPANSDTGAVVNFITCEDCFITKIPDQDYADTAAEQTWVFTCGQVKFSPTL